MNKSYINKYNEFVTTVYVCRTSGVQQKFTYKKESDFV